MVEALGQRFADVPSLQPTDSHFIYQALNLKAPRQPESDNSRQPERGVTHPAELLPCGCPRSFNHTRIVFAMDQLKGRGLKKGPFVKWTSSKN